MNWTHIICVCPRRLGSSSYAAVCVYWMGTKPRDLSIQPSMSSVLRELVERVSFHFHIEISPVKPLSRVSWVRGTPVLSTFKVFSWKTQGGSGPLFLRCCLVLEQVLHFTRAVLELITGSQPEQDRALLCSCLPLSPSIVADTPILLGSTLPPAHWVCTQSL